VLLGSFEHALQQFTAYAVAQGVTQEDAIPDGKKVEAPSGDTYTTAPGTASNIAAAAAAIAGGVHAVGEHVGRGIVYVGQWYRSRATQRPDAIRVGGKTQYTCAPHRSPPSVASCASHVPVMLSGPGQMH
jgi:hypothetical protein